MGVFSELRAFTGQHRRLHIARTHAIDANVVLAMVDGHGPRQVKYAPFSRTIGSRARTSLQGPPGAGIDNAPSAVADHVVDHFAREEINTLQGHIDSLVPLLLC